MCSKFESVFLNTLSAEFPLNGDIVYLLLLKHFANPLSMCIPPERTCLVIDIFIISSAHTELTISAVHGHTRAVHFRADIIRNATKRYNQFCSIFFSQRNTRSFQRKCQPLRHLSAKFLCAQTKSFSHKIILHKAAVPQKFKLRFYWQKGINLKIDTDVTCSELTLLSNTLPSKNLHTFNFISILNWKNIDNSLN